MYTPKPDNVIYVAEIKATTDKESKSVQLKQYSERTPEDNVVGFLMRKHSKFTSQINKRAVYVSISDEDIAGWKLAEGVDFQKACEAGRFKNMRLQRKETLTPRVYKDKNGKITFQTPKTAGTGGDVLLHKGKPVYQNTVLSLKGEPDELIKHDSTVTPEIVDSKPSYQVDAEEAIKAIRAQIKRKNSGFTEADLAIVSPELVEEEAMAGVDDTEIKLAQ